MNNKAKLIFVVGGEIVIIDREDADILQKSYNLRIVPDSNTNYVQCIMRDDPEKRAKLLHRVILEKHGLLKPGVVDHVNRDGLDNRKINLRIATISQNAMNKLKRKNTSSKYIGVKFHKPTRKWLAVCAKKYLGSFINEDDAAIAYNNYASAHFKGYVNLNVVEGARQALGGKG